MVGVRCVDVPCDDEDAVEEQLVLGLVAGLDALLQHVARGRHGEDEQEQEHHGRVAAGEHVAAQTREGRERGQRGMSRDHGS